jgi:hypothetical protein
MESRAFKTYDGVELQLGATMYMTGLNPTSEGMPLPTKVEQNDIDRTWDVPYRFFSTPEACQAYIDSMNEVKHVEFPPTPTATAKTHPYLAELMDSINSSKPKYVQMIGRSKRIKESTGCPYIIDDLETPSTPPFSASAKALKEYDEWKEETNRLMLLSQFSHAYNIPINTVLEFIVNNKSK